MRCADTSRSWWESEPWQGQWRIRLFYMKSKINRQSVLSESNPCSLLAASAVQAPKKSSTSPSRAITCSESGLSTCLSICQSRYQSSESAKEDPAERCSYSYSFRSVFDVLSKVTGDTRR